MFRRIGRARAFTLLELIAVVVAASILAGISVPTFQAVEDRSHDERTKAVLSAILREAKADMTLRDEPLSWEQGLAAAVTDLGIDTTGTWQLLPTGSDSADFYSVGWTAAASGVELNLVSRSGRLCSATTSSLQATTVTWCGDEEVYVPPVNPDPTPSPTPTPTPTPTPDPDPQTRTTVAPLLAPNDLSLSYTTIEGKVELTWTAVEEVTTSTTTAPVVGYRIFRYDTTVSSYVLLHTTSSTTAGVPSVSPWFDLGVNESFRVAAYNSAGEGPVSTTGSITVIGAPTAPTRASSEFAGNGDFTVTYTVAPSSARPLETATLLVDRRSSTAGDVTVPLVVTGNEATATITAAQLAKPATYDLTVTLTNDFGDTVFLDPDLIYVVDVPGMAENLSLELTNTEGEVAASWDAVTGTNERPVSGYRLFQYFAVTDSYEQVYQGTSTDAVIESLTLGQLATFRVAAYGSGGESPRSSDATITPVGLAAAATVDFDVFATGEAVGGFDLTDTVARPVSTMTVTATPPSGPAVTQNADVDLAANTAEITFENETLDREVTYTITYTMQNAFGSATYNGGTVFIPLAAPTAPLNASSVAGNQFIRVSFSAPANTSGLPVSRYIVTCTDPNGEETVKSGASSPITVNGLTNEIDYTCVVQAETSAGTSTNSSSLTDRPTAATYLPFVSPPYGMTTGHAMNGVFYHIGTSEGTSTWSNPNPSYVVTTATSSGTTPRTIYTDRTYSSKGTSALGTHSITFALPAGVALRPTVFSFIDGGSSPNFVYEGSNDGVTYTSLRSVSNATCMNGSPNWWCYYDVSTTTSYRYHRISFIGASTRLYLLEVELYGYYTSSGAPSAPQNITATQMSQDTVKVNFNAPSSGTPSSYTIVCTGSGGATSKTVTTSRTWAYVSGLTPLGSYSCTARATNFAGGTTSSPTTFTLASSSVISRLLTSDRDDNGAIYYVATNNGTSSWTNPCTSGAIMLTSTAGSTSNKCANVDRYYAGYISSSRNTSHWMIVGLPASTSLLPTHYTITGMSGDTVMNDWVFQGSNDLANWADLHTVTDATCLAATCSAALSTNSTYRYFRILFSGDATRARMYTNEIEVYGFYTPAS